MEDITSNEIVTFSEILGVFKEDGSEISYESILKEANHYCIQWNSLYQKINLIADDKVKFYIGAYLSEDFKSYIIFLRNSALQLIYGQLKLDANIITNEEYLDYKIEASENCSNVRAEFLTKIETLENSIKDSEIKEHIHQKNPITEYSAQISELKTHIKKVKQFGNNSKIVTKRLAFVDQKIDESIQSKDENLNVIIDLLQNLDHEIEYSEKELTEKIKNVSAIIEGYDLNKLSDFDFPNFFKNLDSFTTIPEYSNGVINTQKLNLPIILKQIFTVEFGKNFSIQNTKVLRELADVIDHLRLLSNSETKTANYLEWKSQAIENIKNILVENVDLQNKLKSKTSLHSIIYNNYTNVDVATEYSVQQFLKGRDSLLKFVNDTTKKLAGITNLSLFFKEQQSENQMIINFVKTLHKNDTNVFYTKIFLNNSEFFNHYFIPRTEIVDRVFTNISNWEIGLGNAVLLFGERYSGKTSLLNWLSHNSEFHQKIDIKLDQSTVIGGRKFLFTSDLKENLNSIEKSIEVDKKYLVTIDDVELMRNENNPESLLSNIRGLVSSINKAPKNIFFMVSTNPIMKNKLNAILSWEETFADIINVSSFKKESFLKTLEMRHKSTKMILQINEKQMSQNQMESLGLEVIKNCNLNIGLALIAWCRNISNDLNIKRVKLKFPDFPMLVDDHLRITELLYSFRNLSYSEITKFNIHSVKNYKKLIGRFRKIGILNFENNFLEFSPFAGKQLYHQLTFLSRDATYNAYVLKIIMTNLDSDEIETLQIHLLSFSFKGIANVLYISRISSMHLELGIRTVENPATLINFINKHSGMSAEFKNNIK